MFSRTRLYAAGLVVPVFTIVVGSGANFASARPPEPPIARVEPLQGFAHADIKPKYSLARAIEGVAPYGAESKSRDGLDRRLVRLLSLIEGHVGRPIVISSGCRSSRANRRAGGARRSYHIRCMAADIKLAGISEGTLLRFVSRLPGRGGVGTYCRNSIVHVDVGPRRDWSQRCGKIRYRYGYHHKKKRKRRA